MSPAETDRDVELVIDGITDGAEGVGRLDGMAVFVAGALPGERVTARITERRKRWARADLVAVLEPHPDRVTPPCEYLPACGGCDLQQVTPTAQRELKHRIVFEQLQRLGRIADPPVEAVLPVGPDTRYRNSARFHVDAEGRLGFHAAGTHDVVPVADCLVLSTESNQLVQQVGSAGASEVAVRHFGLAGDGRGQVVLHPGSGPLDALDGDARATHVAIAQPDGSTAPLRGDGVISVDVAGFTYDLDGSCFFQVNTGGAEALVREVLAAAADVAGRTVWDLYAGVGLFTLPLAAAGAKVTAVEAHRPATEFARHNLTEAGLDGRVETADVGRWLTRKPAEVDRHPDRRPDVVVLDPPRRGARLPAIGDLITVRPARIVYVACDVASLARDARALTEAGYELQRAQPMDLFPHTHHIETVATFVR